MKKYTSTLVKSCCLAAAYILFAASIAFAQLPGSGGPQPQEEEEEDNTPPPTGVPIDGGASLLLAAGAGYGIKMLRDRRNARKQ
ncbi:PID-CTERM protein-sorting domain-containing protein [Rufibacter psychrotolerans]|uniref:PID-CTERM protein-sorting domain-containing protein n=1 Tax=Rufibacter psychrotolerans TaxID=2812556 RepID=UPI0035B503F6